jgi:3-oxoacyl-[acyl-carrier protein] reductase
MDLKLRGQSVLVTGSTRGIGYEISRTFLEEGAHVFLCGRSEPSFGAALNALRGEFGVEKVDGLCGDLLSASFTDRLLGHIAEKTKRLDSLVLNAGSGKSVSGLEIAAEEWHRMYGLNVVSACELLQKSVPLLRSGTGRSVVFIGSIAGIESLRAPLAYSAAKAALLKLTSDFAQLLAVDKIRVNIVAPGNIMFPGSTWEAKMSSQRSDVEAMLAREVPLQRFGTPGEISRAVAFLASEASSFTTGACLVVDGGQTRSI